MKKVLAFLLTLMLMVCITATSLAAYDINTAKKSVVRILTVYHVIDEKYPEYRNAMGYGVGSGFALGVPGEPVRYVATAGHVVNRYLDSGNVAESTEPVMIDGKIVFLKVQVDYIHVLKSDASSYIVANVDKVSAQADLAILKLVDDSLPREAAVLVDRKTFEIGESLTSMGFPAAAEANIAAEVQDQLLSDTTYVTTNVGGFAAWRGNAETKKGDQIATTAEMSSGISGGPLVDSRGYVVGVCVSGSSSTDNSNYAVASDELIMLIGGISELNVPIGPLKEGMSTTTIIIIAAAVVVVAVLAALLIASSKNKKNMRTLVLTGTMAGKSVQLKKNIPVVIGRDPNRCQIVYPKDTAGVSSVHCTITYDGTQVTVADNGSSYGTTVGGTKVEPGKPMVMHRGQEVTFGSDKNTAELH